AAAIASARSTFRLVLSYDGTDYHGWQAQAGARTVQGTLVQAARDRFGADTRVTGASRTDAGVHALGQVASLTTAARITAAGLRRARAPCDPPEGAARGAAVGRSVSPSYGAQHRRQRGRGRPRSARCRLARRGPRVARPQTGGPDGPGSRPRTDPRDVLTLVR